MYRKFALVFRERVLNIFGINIAEKRAILLQYLLFSSTVSESVAGTRTADEHQRRTGVDHQSITTVALSHAPISAVSARWRS